MANKQKTKKAVSKRFKVTAKGRLKRNSAGRGHLFMSKTSKQKRRLRQGGMVSDAETKRFRDLIQN